MRRHPIFALLDNASLRQLGIGACVAVGIVGVYAGVQQLTSEPDRPPSEWLSGPDEQQLREGIEFLAADVEDAWVAGCAWQHELRLPGDVLDLPGSNVDNFEAQSESGRDLTFAVGTDAGPGEELGEFSAPGYFCLSPMAFAGR